jgi:hypothetical protein
MKVLFGKLEPYRDVELEIAGLLSLGAQELEDFRVENWLTCVQNITGYLHVLHHTRSRAQLRRHPHACPQLGRYRRKPIAPGDHHQP